MPITPLDASLMVLATVEAVVAAFLLRRETLLRQQAERVARESQERSVEIQRLARIGTWEYDMVTEQIRWSDETFHIFGRTPGSQEPDFADILLAIHPEDSPVFDNAIERAINDGESYYLDMRIRLPEGTQKDIQAQGSPVRDTHGRLGGDEFCVLLPRTTAAQAQTCVERIRRRLQAAAFANGEATSYGVTATFGIAGLSPGMTEAALLV
jgi:PAS domain-containing protein